MVTDSRSRMIQTAALLLAKKGLQGASFSEVLAASSAPRGSIYHHFPEGKDQLVGEALSLAQARAMLDIEAQRGNSPHEVAETFVGLWRDILVASKFQAGCAVVAVTVASGNETLINQAASVFRGWHETLAGLLAEGGIGPERAESLAALLIAACEGAVIVARASGSLAGFDTTAAELLRAVDAA